jgi:hypothetical protein
MEVIEVRGMAFNATFTNISVISWRSVLLMEETGVPGENHQPVASHWQTLSPLLELLITIVIYVNWYGYFFLNKDNTEDKNNVFRM